MEQYIESFSKIAEQLLPILGLLALILVIILIIKLIKVLGSVDSTLVKTHGTIDLVDKSIEKIQAPLDTTVKISHTVDKAHDATVEAVGTAKDFVVRNAVDIKNKVSNIVNKDEQTQLIEENNFDDMVGGED